MKNNIEPFKQRTADLDIYLKENRYKKPKEIFIKLAELAAPSISNDSLVVDLGCAAGEFLYYLKSRFENAKLIGADLLPELIEKAEKNVNGVSFRTGSVLDQKLFVKESLDVSFYKAFTQFLMISKSVFQISIIGQSLAGKR